MVITNMPLTLWYRMCFSSQCSAQDGEENVEHLFTSCSRTQVAWAWARRKIMNLMTFDDSLPSNFELLHLSYVLCATGEGQ